MEQRAMMKRSSMKRGGMMRAAACATALSALILAAGPALMADELRISTMGNCMIALPDRDNQLNPYDYGRNPAYLLSDFETSWIRFGLSVSEEEGSLKRPYDPQLLNTGYGTFQGRKRLSDRQAMSGSFRYQRLWQREQRYSLEIDQYNDPFYLTDATTADFKHWGPVMTADYSFRLGERVSIGAGLDYEISTGLKDYYTRPEIVHNYARGALGLLVQPRPSWLLGFVVRPERLQNRTNFDKADEGYDNIIYRYAGDAIYEIRSFSSYAVKELAHGTELGVQNFITTGRLGVGALFSYRFVDNSIRYNVTNPEEVGYWQDETLDFSLMARYSLASIPVIFGVSGRVMDQDGWAKRPRFDDVLLYDSPVQLRSAGAGVSYSVAPLHVIVSAEYVMNSYDIEANDYGANSFRAQEFIQNVGRFGVEYAAYNVFSIRGGVEVTDYLADRWLKLPINTDRYRFTAGASIQWHLWEVEAQLLYARNTTGDFGYEDLQRRDLSGVVWLTHLEK